MFNFFYSLYLSLFTGSWYLQTSNPIEVAVNRTASLIVNTLGGEFTTLQNFTLLDASLTGYQLFALILAVITMFMVCFAVLKLTKAVFSIFFGGR